MKISIIDIGTQSLKHYIFDVAHSQKKLIHYKRYSDANLGENEVLSEEAIQRNVDILKGCITLNQKEGVSKLQILGTEILRKAHNAKDFTDIVKQLSGNDIQIISHDQEALYLYEGFITIVPENVQFAAVNIGGGSTELVVGDKHALKSFKKIPFGVKVLKNKFCVDGKIKWEELDAYLHTEIDLSEKAENLFITGVLDFITVVGPHLGLIPQKNSLPNHPIKMNIEEYTFLVDLLRKTSIEDLRTYYPKDPHYADNIAIGQSVYLAIAQKLGVTTIIPSNNDLTDGVIYHLTQ